MPKKPITKTTKSVANKVTIKKIAPAVIEKPKAPIPAPLPPNKKFEGFKTFPVVSVEMTYYSTFNTPFIKYVWSKENGFVCNVKVEDLNKVLIQPLFMLKDDYRSIEPLAKKLTRF